jgi:hypothetical protein
MLADYYGPAYSDVLKHTAKLAGGISLGSAVYVLGAIPGYAALSSFSPRGASLTYATLMGLASVWVAQKYARESDLVMAGSAAVFVESIYTAVAAMYAGEAEIPPVAASSALPGKVVAGLFDLDNKSAIHALTRLPML